MGNNLAIDQLAENEATPEVVVNDGTLALDNALTEQLAVDLSAGNGTISLLQSQRNMFFSLEGVATGGRTVTFSAAVRRGLLLVECPAANTNTVSLIRGSTTLTLKPGRLYAVRLDGTANGLVARDIAGTAGEANDLHIFIPGVMDNAQLLYRMKVTRAFTLPINLTGSYVTAVTAATGSTVLTIKKNGSSIGTATFGAASDIAVLVFSAAVSFDVTDIVTLHGPAIADATLADVSADFLGSR